MPRRETRLSIESALTELRYKRMFARDEFERLRAMMEQHLAILRETLDPADFARARKRSEDALVKMRTEMKRRFRRRGDGSMPAPVEPPHGPKPFAGGAAAALEFD